MSEILSMEEIDMMLSGTMPKIETAEQALEAVKKSSDGFVLQYVPEKFKTLELCLLAVKKGCHRHVLECIPEEFKKAEFYIERVKISADIGAVPEEYKSAELYCEMVKAHSWTLANVPEEFKTVNICAEAVKQDCWTILLAPESIRDNVMEAAGFEVAHYKYESMLEAGVKGIFEKEAERICLMLIKFVEIARREGLLALGEHIGAEKISNDLMEFGIKMALDGKGKGEIEAYIDSWIKENCNNSVAYYEKILASIIKAGVLAIWCGESPKIAPYKIIGLIPTELMPSSLSRLIKEQTAF